MSSLWTPSGERPVDRPAPSEPEPSVGPEPTDEELAQLAELQRQLLNVPAAVVVANHAIGLFQLGALHLNQEQPNLEQAQVAIDALAAIVERLGSRLGEHEDVLRDALAQLQMAYVQVRDQA